MSRPGYIETEGHCRCMSDKPIAWATDRARHGPDGRESLGHLAVRQEKPRAWAWFRPVITSDQDPRRRETEPPKLYQHRSVRAVHHVEVMERKIISKPGRQAYRCVAQ